MSSSFTRIVCGAQHDSLKVLHLNILNLVLQNTTLYTTINSIFEEGIKAKRFGFLLPCSR